MDDSLNKALPRPSDMWTLRHGFFWYNDTEIFHSSEDGLTRRTEKLAKVGINHVMTFSCTHFRWSFRRHWDLLTDTLAKIVRALVVHVVNAAGLLDKEDGETISFDDPVPFPSHAGGPEASIEIRLPECLRTGGLNGDAQAFFIDQSEPVKLDCRRNDNTVTVDVDPALIKDYVLIEIR